MLRKSPSMLKFSLYFAVLALSTSASALEIDLNIDFRDGSIWSESDSSNNGVTVRGVPNRLYRDNRDGYGIRGGENDEIDRREKLIVDFSFDYYDTRSAIAGILLTDLFGAPDGRGKGESGWVRVVLVDGSAFRVRFFQDSNDPNGEYYVDLGGAYEVDRFVFHAGRRRGSEYSVAGIVQVPEPGTLAMFGFGLLMIGVLRRRPASAKSNTGSGRSPA